MRVSVTIPVFNEENVLRESVTTLHAFLTQNLRFDYEIVIADNGSTDRTLEIANALGREFPNVGVIHSDEKGRGGVLKCAWLQRQAEILCYMDADLSTNLEAFPLLVEALANGGCDLAIGSRLLRPAHTKRSIKREFISRCYNLLVKVLMRTHFSDAQCGFKAITRRAAQNLLPLVEDPGWFFDTELLVIAEKLEYRIFDLPVHWVERRESRVKLFRTAIDDLRGLARLRRRLQHGLSVGGIKDLNVG